jgi:hypothetical protein
MTTNAVTTAPESAVPGDPERLIAVVRGLPVMLDNDLAALYGVPTRSLLQAVRRNEERFPPDFSFRLTPEENETRLRSQFVISNSGRGGRRYLPYAFTEQGVAMLSSVLRCARAVAVNIEIMRAFVRMRRLLVSHAELAARVTELEERYDAHFKVVFDALRGLMDPPPGAAPVRRLGFSIPAEEPLSA